MMSPRLCTITPFTRISVWLAGVMLTATAFLLLSTLVSAQQDSTESTLSTPTLTAQTGENGVDLSWTAITGATHYELYAWTSADGWQQIGGDNLTDTSYTHTDVTDGTTYYYAVRAVNANENSGWSNYASAVASTPALSAPALTAQVTANGIELSWTAVSGAVRYELWAWTNADSWWEIGGNNLTGTTFTHTEVTAGITYFYTVRAVNADDDKSGWSPNISALAQQQQTATVTPTPTITLTPPPPSSNLLQPTATHTPQSRQQQQREPGYSATPTATATETVTVPSTLTPTPTATPPAVPSLFVAADESSVLLSWSVATGAARYELWVWDSVDLGRRIGGNNLTATTYTQSSLVAGRTYHYAIRSVGDTGVASDWSSYVPATIPSHTATPTATNTLEAQQQQNVQTTTPTATPTPTPTLYSGPTLTPTVTHTPTPTPQYSERPDVPNSPSVIVLGAGHVRVDWNDVPRATYYDLWYWAYPYWRSVKDEAAKRGISYTFNGSSAVLTNMPTDFESYSFRVIAENSVGLRISTSGSATNPEQYRLLPTATPTVTPTVTPTPVGWPSAPNQPTASMNSNGSVSISWETVPETASYDVWLYHYVVFGFLRRWVQLPYDGVDVEVDGYVREDIRISISGTSATVTNLPYKTTYYFRVRAHNDVGSTFSPSVSVANINAITATPTATPTALSTATPTPTPTTSG